MRDRPINTASQDNKAMRGVKRACQACEVRFYDLLRKPIVCPSCGAQHTPAARPVVEAGARLASFAGKTSWRSKGFKRWDPTLPVADPEQDATAEAVAAEDVSEETASAVPEDDIVLEQEPDDGDVSGLVGHDVEQPKER